MTMRAAAGGGRNAERDFRGEKRSNDTHVPPGGPLAGDRGFDAALRERGVTPHVAQNVHDTDKARRRSDIDGRTTRHPGCAACPRARKRIEEAFGWLTTVVGWRKLRVQGLDRIEHGLRLALAASNLGRMSKIIAAGAAWTGQLASEAETAPSEPAPAHRSTNRSRAKQLIKNLFQQAAGRLVGFDQNMRCCKGDDGVEGPSGFFAS